METINTDVLKLEALRTNLKGAAYVPGDEGYDGARATWNLNAHQYPALVVEAESATDVLAVVRLAREQGLGVGVMATGHGVAAPADGGVLINTSRMKGVHVDPETRTARVESGVKWADVISEAAAHGLAGLQGSSSDVGVVGYTMGGGFGWLGRKYGFAADSVKEADVVTADGELLKVSAHENADLFWGLKGGGGNFGIVTSLEFALYPITHVYGGNLFYPVEKADDVLKLYSHWSAGLPDEVTSGVAFMNFPPFEEIPEPLRGNSLMAMRFCYTGEDLQEKGEELLRPWREEFGEPVMDTFGVMSYEAMDAISMDPVDPMGAYGHVEMLRDLSTETAETLVKLAGADSNSPLAMLELRQLGGALSRPPAELDPMGRSDCRFIMYGLGVTPTPEVAQAVQAYLAYVAEAVRPHASGAAYVNFIDLDGTTVERVRAAYSPEDWRRLVALKGRHDPTNLFRFNRNIPPSSTVTSAVKRDKDSRKEKIMTDIIGKKELPHIIGKEELPCGKIARWFEGYRYGDVDVSFFLIDSPPGGGPVLHTHPYEEVFVTLEGEATFTVGDATIEVSAGQIVVAPADVPHKFVNSGSGLLRQVDIHPSGRIQQVNIPEDA